MQIADPSSLKAYLVKELTNLSDADPDILADYIMALLKHDRPDLEQSCSMQLNDFLHDHTRVFVERLFKFLKGDGQSSRPLREERREDRYFQRGAHRSEMDRRRSRSPQRSPPRSENRLSKRVTRKPYTSDQTKSNKRLVLDRIPSEFCTISAVHECFSKFGTLVNVNVNKDEHKAVIEYGTPEEASKAHQCPEVIFNNRFVRLFWDKENGEMKPRKAPIQFPKVTNYVSPDYPPKVQQQQKQAMILELSKQKEGLLREYLNQQRLLMDKLENDQSLDAASKEDIMNTLSILQEKIDSVIAPVRSEAAVEAPQSKSKRLDLRQSTTIKISPIPEKLSQPEEARMLLSTFGIISELVIDENSIFVCFSTRAEAEKVFSISDHILGNEDITQSRFGTGDNIMGVIPIPIY